jgi:crotonobetainyl-CoA:carnitine CoA-transferase CaiB-like acyl-CoA transferase
MGTLRSPNTIVATGSDGVRFVVQTPLHFRARLADLLGLTYVGSEDYADLVRTRLAADTGEAWMRIIGEAGIPVAPLQTFAAALALEDTDSIEVDGHLLPGVPFSFDGGRHRLGARPPNLGEHQVEVVGS